MQTAESYLITKGARIFYRTLTPDAVIPRAQIAIIHGLGEHSGRHQALAEYLVTEGYRVVLHDQRGAGKSSGLRGHVDSFQDYLDDLNTVLAATKGAEPVFLLGHSMGGLIAALYAITYSGSLSGLILSSPALQPKLATPLWKMVVAKLLATAFPRLRLSSGLPLEKLAHDPKVAENYRTDPLCSGKVSTNWYLESLRQMAIAREQAGQITVPTLILQAGNDAFVDPETTRQFFLDLTVSHKKLEIYEGAYHEIFREPCGDRARQEVTEWIKLTI